MDNAHICTVPLSLDIILTILCDYIKFEYADYRLQLKYGTQVFVLIYTIEDILKTFKTVIF